MAALLFLAHRAPADGHDWSGFWHSSPALGAPQVSEAMEAALRREVMGQDAGRSAPICWHHCDPNSWGAVVDLHRAGDHDTASDLARLLRWCDQQHTGREVGCWEIRHA